MIEEENAPIIVRVKVEVPQGGSVSGKRVRRRRFVPYSLPAGTIQINDPGTQEPGPSGGGMIYVARVRVGSGMGNVGSICARGTSQYEDDLGGIHHPTHVITRVYQGIVNSNNLDVYPDLTDPGYVINPANPGTNPSPNVRTFYCTGSSWIFTGAAELPGVACGSDSMPINLPTNTLVVWAHYGGLGYDVRSRIFRGRCDTGTDCDASGSGSGGFMAGPAMEQASVSWPRLTATFQNKEGDYEGYPNRVLLVKQPGKKEWAWQHPKNPASSFRLVYDEGAGAVTLCGTDFEPALIRPEAGFTLKPPSLIFRVKGRGDQSGNRGSFTMLVTE